MKTRPVAAELFYADGRTDGQRQNEVKVAFRKFLNTSKKGSYMEICIHLKSNECCSTATLSKHIRINTELHKKN